MTKIITSLQNPMVKNLLLLQEKARVRKDQDLIVVEGVREINLAIASGFVMTSLFYLPAIFPKEMLDELTQNIVSEPIEVSAEVFDRVAYRKGSGGVIALFRPKWLNLSDIRKCPTPLILVLETVEKPGNLGALLRTADAAALDAVIVCDPQTDLYNPNAIRSSLGCIFTLPVVVSSSAEVIDWMKSHSIRTFGTALTAKKYYQDCDFTTASAIIMGSEAFGLSKTWLEQADELIKIPMMGKVDSMNVSVSAAIVVFEAKRQRDFRK